MPNDGLLDNQDSEWLKDYRRALKISKSKKLLLSLKRKIYYEQKHIIYNYSFIANFAPDLLKLKDPIFTNPKKFSSLVYNILQHYRDYLSEQDVDKKEKNRLLANMSNFMNNSAKNIFVKNEDKHKYKLEIKEDNLYSNGKILDSKTLLEDTEGKSKEEIMEIYEELLKLKKSQYSKNQKFNYYPLISLEDYMNKINNSCFILDKNGDIYIFPFVPFVKNHNFITKNEDVKAAGMINIKDGKINSIFAFSGHYSPDKGSLFLFLEKLKELSGDSFEKIFNFDFKDFHLNRNQGLKYFQEFKTGGVFVDFTKYFHENIIDNNKTKHL